jgi:hypothetical protein
MSKLSVVLRIYEDEVSIMDDDDDIVIRDDTRFGYSSDWCSMLGSGRRRQAAFSLFCPDRES